MGEHTKSMPLEQAARWFGTPIEWLEGLIRRGDCSAGDSDGTILIIRDDTTGEERIKINGPPPQPPSSIEDSSFKKGDIIEYRGSRYVLISDETAKEWGGTGGVARQWEEAETTAEKLRLVKQLEPYIEVAKIKDDGTLPTERELTLYAYEAKGEITLHERNGRILFKK
jgi:hypothetical protein